MQAIKGPVSLKKISPIPVMYLLALATGMIACGHSAETPAADKAEKPAAGAAPSWASKMQSLSEILSELLPLVAIDQKFKEPANLVKIKADTERLRELAHSLKTESFPPNSDPGLAMTASLFEDDISRASSLLKSGQADNARVILRSTTSYCIQCHTQTNNGPSFPRLALNIDTPALAPMERAQFFAATRQFERAQDEFTALVADKKFAHENAFDWEIAARSSVAISVKVEKDPNRLIQLIKKIEANPSTPQFVSQLVNPWLASAKDWKSEKNPLLRSPTEQMKFAEKLIKRAQSAQKFPMDHSQDILYFRASAVLHDLLSARRTRDEVAARALYFSGVAAEATRDLNFWTLHETYYEMCIKAAPHTDISRDCYARLNDSIVMGYTGTGGTQIPSEIERKLVELKKLVAPAAAGNPQPKSTPETH